MDLKQISSSQGTLKVIERQKNIWKIECYVCRNERGLFLAKIYPLPECENAFEKENDTIRSFSDTNLVLRLVDFNKEKSRGMLIFDYSGYLSLSQRISSLHSNEFHKLITNIVTNLQKVHSSNIIYGNLSADTIFVSSSLDIKFTGFEFSTNLEEIEVLRSSKKTLDTHQAIETKAPELLNSGFEVDSSVDMWSLGCLVYQIVCQSRPLEMMEEQKIGKYVESIQEGVWKILVRRLLIVDPRLRGNCSELLALLNSPLPSESKQTWTISSMFSKSTNSWVKHLTQDCNSRIDTFIFGKLVTKAMQKPNKIPKFYDSLQRRSLFKPRVCLKCLVLLHNYIFVSNLNDLNTRTIEILDIVQMNWTTSQNKNKQKYFSGTSKQVIIQYVSIIREKFRLHHDYRINCDWNLVNRIEEKKVKELLAYYKSITNFATLIFNLNDFIEIYTDIVQILLSEQQQLNLIFFHELDEIMDTEIIQEFSKCNKKNVALVHQVYLKHPFLEIPSTTYSPSNSLVGRMMSETPYIESESSVSESIRLSSNPNEGSLFSEPDFNESQKEDLSIANPTDLEFEEVIGQGSSCTVYRGKYKEKKVAIKLMKQLTNKNAFVKEFHREIETLSKLRHINLVGFVGACIGERSCIVIEYCGGKTLFNLLHERKDVKLSWKQRVKFAIDISEGMSYLHSINPPIIHRDLKSLNLLLSDPINSPEDTATIKITDFGVSRIMSADHMTGHIGTCHWMAPEILKDLPYGLPSDVYSFGIVLWEILARETPYKGISPTAIPFQVINHGRRPDMRLIAESCPQELIRIMNKCWDSDPIVRPTFPEISKMLGDICLK